MKRWTALGRPALILQLIRCETIPAKAVRKYYLLVRETEERRDRAMAAMENALRSRPRDEAEEKEHCI